MAPPPARPRGTKTRIGEANVEKILDAALPIFAGFGLRGARTDQLAEAAGMSKPNLHYYFRTKQDLYVAVLERTLRNWLEPLAAIDRAADPRVALSAYVEAKLSYSRDFPDASRLFATEIIQGGAYLAASLDGELTPLVAATVETFEVWIAEGRLAPIDPQTLLFTIWATTQHYADFAAQIALLTGRSLEDPAFFSTTRDTLLRILVDGVLRPPA
ncbi:TetR family transcriptional regulator [Siculibacillus lacustris]|uniref:TetR family transcriptional regulator n=1 Tax=Siculibacillus lacustris TaxID=1549641 RepID=A0A4Q9VZH7_9HYPH|nr:TetR family transcriptional regulator C-terminal domain-containing protein [Siculibacillus lacustris]TBW41228.1 TetR family transcriptional regulator [Siculibacillus lacustris]